MNIVKKISMLLLVALTINSCKVQFVPAYDAAIVQQVTEGAQATDALYLKMIASVNKNFATYAGDYAGIEAQINSIIVADEIRPQAANISSIANNLKEKFVQYENDHKVKVTLNNAELQAYQLDLKALWKPLLISERSLLNNR